MAEPKTVTLLDKEGREFRASHPAEISSLVYGAGYRIKDKSLTPDKAAELLATKGPVADQLETPPAPPAAGGGK